MEKIRLRFLDISNVRNLLRTSGRDVLSIFYQDAFNWLLGNVLWDSLHYPTHFYLEETAHAIEDFLGISTISKDASSTIALDACWCRDCLVINLYVLVTIILPSIHWRHSPWKRQHCQGRHIFKSRQQNLVSQPRSLTRTILCITVYAWGNTFLSNGFTDPSSF